MFTTTKFTAAVRHAILNTDIGYVSSSASLVDAAFKFYTPKAGKSKRNDEQARKKALAVRRELRIANGVDADARTYRSQFRRDMRNDSKLSLFNLSKARQFVNKVGAEEVAAFLGLFHSIDIAKLTVESAKQMNQFVELE